jgi:peptidyl-tRNA hydrolase
LSKVPKAERELLDLRIADAADAAELIVARGVDVAMQRYNGTR